MAMAAWTAAARQNTQVSRLSSTKLPHVASYIPRRGLAGGGGDHHGPPKVNFWQDPLNPSRWKEEHVSLIDNTMFSWNGILFCI
ncbi:hypothetical protein Ancab_004362 [Ancistrocladus abbreviatus]